MTYEFLDRWSKTYAVFSIRMDSISITYDIEIVFAWSTDTSFHIQVKCKTVESILNVIFLSGWVE